MQSFLIAFFVAALFIAALVVIGWLVYELLGMRKRLHRYKGISDLEAEQDKIRSVSNKLTEKNEQLKAEQDRLKEEGVKIKKGYCRAKCPVEKPGW
jgi:cell division protein FtsB